MSNQSTQQNKKLHTAITAGFLGLVVLVGVSILYGGTPQPAQAQSTDCGYDVCQNESAEFTINTQAIPATIDSFQRTSGGSTIFENENFQLSWQTTNASRVFATGSWNYSSLAADGGRFLSESNPTSYTYTLSVEDADGTVTDTQNVGVSVVDRPERYDLSLSYPSVDIDGVPGSIVQQRVDINGENGFSGDVDLSVENIPDSLKDSSGNNKVSFTFDNSTISGGDGATDLSMEVIQAIDESVSPMITVRANDTSGTAQDQVKEETFRLNVDAFSPRTIEEF